jgi:DNA polymerase alpha subunit B
MDAEGELNEFFAGTFPDGIPKDILAELLSMLRVHSISAEELFYKWESYSIKMGEGVTLTMQTVRGFKQDVQEALERESRDKAGRHTEKRSANMATPRGAAAAGSDMFGMFDQLTPTASNARSANGLGSAKRKAEFTSPATPRVSKFEKSGSQTITNTPTGTPGDGMQYVFFGLHDVLKVLTLRTEQSHSPIDQILARRWKPSMRTYPCQKPQWRHFLRRALSLPRIRTSKSLVTSPWA